MSNNRGTSLLPTDGIKDAQTRAFLDRLVEAWGEITGDSGFVKKDEFGRLAADSIMQGLSPGVLGGTNIGDPGGPSINQAIDVLADSIRKSLLYQLLTTPIPQFDLNQFRVAVNGAIAYAASGISTETTIRHTQDMALASAINNIWAYVGGSTAVINDGTLASATPTTATATKWTQVIAAVTDPNTGLVNSASIRQQLDTYADAVNAKFNALYTVRAEIDVGGSTLMGGFGLSAVSGSGSITGPDAQGSEIDFGVRADKFWIGSTTSTPSLGTQLGSSYNEFPFIVVTSTTTISGITYSPGVYMKTAFIVDASITTAKIQDAAISNAKIGNYIASNNFNGTITSGVITANGTTGWAIDKNGNAVFNNIKVRGDIEATSLNGSNIVNTTNVTTNAIGQPYFATTASGTSCSLSVVIPSGCAGAVITVSPGQSYSGGVGKDAPGAWNPNYAYFTINDGTTTNSYHSESYVFVSPPAGTYTVTATRSISGGTTDGMYLSVMVVKR